MFFGALIFLVFVASACFGIGMLIVCLVLCCIRQFRRYGRQMLAAGIAGACIGFGIAATLNHFVDSEPEFLGVMGALFSASGFGFCSAIAAAILLAHRFLRHPTRWVDRQKLKSQVAE